MDFVLFFVLIYLDHFETLLLGHLCSDVGADVLRVDVDAVGIVGDFVAVLVKFDLLFKCLAGLAGLLLLHQSGDSTLTRLLLQEVGTKINNVNEKWI